MNNIKRKFIVLGMIITFMTPSFADAAIEFSTIRTNAPLNSAYRVNQGTRVVTPTQRTAPAPAPAPTPEAPARTTNTNTTRVTNTDRNIVHKNANNSNAYLDDVMRRNDSGGVAYTQASVLSNNGVVQRTTLGTGGIILIVFLIIIALIVARITFVQTMAHQARKVFPRPIVSGKVSKAFQKVGIEPIEDLFNVEPIAPSLAMNNVHQDSVPQNAKDNQDNLMNKDNTLEENLDDQSGNNFAFVNQLPEKRPTNEIDNYRGSFV